MRSVSRLVVSYTHSVLTFIGGVSKIGAYEIESIPTGACHQARAVAH